MHANIIHDAKYGNMGFVVSRLGIHNPKEIGDEEPF